MADGREQLSSGNSIRQEHSVIHLSTMLTRKEKKKQKEKGTTTAMVRFYDEATRRGDNAKKWWVNL